jgi:hypothetical protein
MSPNLIGALVGLAFGLADYVLFGALIARAVRRGEEGGGTRALDLVRKAQLFLFPLVGWFVGPYVAGWSGAS